MAAQVHTGVFQARGRAALVPRGAVLGANPCARCLVARLQGGHFLSGQRALGLAGQGVLEATHECGLLRRRHVALGVAGRHCIAHGVRLGLRVAVLPLCQRGGGLGQVLVDGACQPALLDGVEAGAGVLRLQPLLDCVQNVLERLANHGGRGADFAVQVALDLTAGSAVFPLGGGAAGLLAQGGHGIAQLGQHAAPLVRLVAVGLVLRFGTRILGGCFFAVAFLKRINHRLRCF